MLVGDKNYKSRTFFLFPHIDPLAFALERFKVCYRKRNCMYFSALCERRVCMRTYIDEASVWSGTSVRWRKSLEIQFYYKALLVSRAALHRREHVQKYVEHSVSIENGCRPFKLFIEIFLFFASLMFRVLTVEMR